MFNKRGYHIKNTNSRKSSLNKSGDDIHQSSRVVEIKIEQLLIHRELTGENEKQRLEKKPFVRYGQQG